MFEARLIQGCLLKKVVDSIKDLVTDANFDCSPSGFTLQAMDNSHVSLVGMSLKSDGFEFYRCDRAMSMGECQRGSSMLPVVLRQLPPFPLPFPLPRHEPRQLCQGAQMRGQ